MENFNYEKFTVVTDEELYEICGGGKIPWWLIPAYDFSKGVIKGFIQTGKKDKWGG